MLQSFGLDDEAVVATSHFPRPASKIAENVTVITAEEIERLNAHTLADVLQSVTGIQLDEMRTPGSFTFFSMMSFYSRHILVQIDGVPQNFVSTDGTAFIGSMPVQQIDRVEIVKGAASAAWGSALGGVINIITKTPMADRAAGGTTYMAAGERRTSDLRGELTGTVDRLGYYITGGNISSRGILPGNSVNFNHAFGKLSYDLPASSRLTLGLDFRDSVYALEDFVPFDYRDTGGYKNASGYLSFRRLLADRLTLDLNGYLGRRQATTQWGGLSGPALFKDSTVREDSHGANARVLWGDAGANLAAGLEYEHVGIRQRDLATNDPVSNFDMSLDRVGTYLNASYTFGPLTLLPGIRYDHTSQLDDAFSYSLGAVIRLTDSTLLRLYGARGYSMPIISRQAIMNGRRELQNIETIQAGIETTTIPYLWLKGTLFFNNIWKIQEWDTSTTPSTAILREQVRQGFELEAKSSPLYGFAVTGGYTYTDAWDKRSKAQLTGGEGAPMHGAKMALNYDNDRLGLRGVLTGNYVWWRLLAGSNAQYKSIIWDLHLTQKFWPANELSPELFFSVHNLFNGYQYQTQVRPNTPRWFEGGVRFRF